MKSSNCGENQKVVVFLVLETTILHTTPQVISREKEPQGSEKKNLQFFRGTTTLEIAAIVYIHTVSLGERTRTKPMRQDCGAIGKT